MITQCCSEQLSNIEEDLWWSEAAFFRIQSQWHTQSDWQPEPKDLPQHLAAPCNTLWSMPSWSWSYSMKPSSRLCQNIIRRKEQDNTLQNSWNGLHLNSFTSWFGMRTEAKRPTHLWELLPVLLQLGRKLGSECRASGGDGVRPCSRASRVSGLMLRLEPATFWSVSQRLNLRARPPMTAKEANIDSVQSPAAFERRRKLNERWDYGRWD